MSQQIINVGATANDHTGDPLRNAFVKTNANFTELYALLNTVATLPIAISDVTGLQSILINLQANVAFIPGIQTDIVAINNTIALLDAAINNQNYSILDLYQIVADLQVQINTKISDAPIDGLIYGRQDGTWVEVSGSTGPTLSAAALPVPRLMLSDGAVDITWLDADTNAPGSSGAASLSRSPVISVQDFSQEFLDTHSVYLEMVMYKRMHGNAKKSFRRAAYVIPSAWYPIDPGIDRSVAWGTNFMNRCGRHRGVKGFNGDDFGFNRPNHYKVTNINTLISAGEYLNGRFMWDAIKYRNSSGEIKDFETLVPIGGKRSSSANRATSRYAYSSWYSPLYIAFRYVQWDQEANEGRGAVYSGPLSKTVKICHSHFPFIQDFNADPFGVQPIAYLDPGHNPFLLKCWMETKLP